MDNCGLQKSVYVIDSFSLLKRQTYPRVFSRQQHHLLELFIDVYVGTWWNFYSKENERKHLLQLILHVLLHLTPSSIFKLFCQSLVNEKRTFTKLYLLCGLIKNAHARKHQNSLACNKMFFKSCRKFRIYFLVSK